MSNIFSCGETVKGFKVKVVNENEVRAAAGILFLFAIISFLNSWLVGDFVYTKIFVVIFLVEFAIRVLINPKFAPSLILSKFITRGQKPLYTGAIQKRWAWSIGLVLAVLMLNLIVLNDIKGPLNLFTCLLCLILLFFEAAFGICIGCKIYKLFNNNPLQECPDGKCEIHPMEEIQKINFLQLTIVAIFFVFIYIVSTNMEERKIINKNSNIVESKIELNVQKEHSKQENKIEILKEKTEVVNDECQPPQWAIDMGHGEKWKLHHGCK